MPRTIWRDTFAASRDCSFESNGLFALKAFAIAIREAFRAAGSPVLEPAADDREGLKEGSVAVEKDEAEKVEEGDAEAEAGGGAPGSGRSGGGDGELSGGGDA